MFDNLLGPRITSGGFGVVYMDKTNPSRVVKVMSFSIDTSELPASRCLRECNFRKYCMTWPKEESKYIVKTHDIFIDPENNKVAIVQDRLEQMICEFSETLPVESPATIANLAADTKSDDSCRKNNVRELVCKSFLFQMSQMISAFHRRGLVVRDFNMYNVMTAVPPQALGALKSTPASAVDKLFQLIDFDGITFAATLRRWKSTFLTPMNATSAPEICIETPKAVMLADKEVHFGHAFNRFTDGIIVESAASVAFNTAVAAANDRRFVTSSSDYTHDDGTDPRYDHQIDWWSLGATSMAILDKARAKTEQKFPESTSMQVIFKLYPFAAKAENTNCLLFHQWARDSRWSSEFLRDPSLKQVIQGLLHVDPEIRMNGNTVLRLLTTNAASVVAVANTTGAGLVTTTDVDIKNEPRIIDDDDDIGSKAPLQIQCIQCINIRSERNEIASSLGKHKHPLQKILFPKNIANFVILTNAQISRATIYVSCRVYRRIIDGLTEVKALASQKSDPNGAEDSKENKSQFKSIDKKIKQIKPFDRRKIQFSVAFFLAYSFLQDSKEFTIAELFEIFELPKTFEPSEYKLYLLWIWSNVLKFIVFDEFPDTIMKIAKTITTATSTIETATTNLNTTTPTTRTTANNLWELIHSCSDETFLSVYCKCF